MAFRYTSRGIPEVPTDSDKLPHRSPVRLTGRMPTQASVAVRESTSIRRPPRIVIAGSFSMRKRDKRPPSSAFTAVVTT